MQLYEFISILATIIFGGIASVGVIWFGLDRMKTDIKTDAKAAHDAIGRNIDNLRTELETLRTEHREDIGALRTEVSDMRKEITDINGRVGRIEGMLQIKKDTG